VDEQIESSITQCRAPDDFTRNKPGFRNLSTGAIEEVTDNQKFERAGNSWSPGGPGLRQGSRCAAALLSSPPVAG